MSLFDEIKNLLPAAGARLMANVLMAERSTFRIGGPADVFFEPAGETEIELVARYCQRNQIPLTILGNGSNILVSDRGIRGVVISIGEQMADFSFEGNMLKAQAGARLSALAAAAAKRGLAGIEFASGIPGTLGGAILMNAGAYDRCMADVIVLTQYLDASLVRKALVGTEHKFSYRRSVFCEQPGIVLRACLKLAEDDPQAILARMADLAARRRASQPLEQPSAGSVFKRPSGYYAGKLISDCGLKGCRVGDAQVSEKHAGFIVNLGHSNAADTRRLIDLVKRDVAEKTGVWLEPEIRFIGEWQDLPDDNGVKE